MTFDGTGARSLGSPWPLPMAPRGIGGGLDLMMEEAGAADAAAIVALVSPHAGRGDMLPLTAESVSRRIRDADRLGPFFVVRERSGGRAGHVDRDGRGVGSTHYGAVVACGALRFWTPTDAEIRSLAVSDALRGKGVGRSLLALLEAEARARTARVAFALTRSPAFFASAGYAEVSPGLFPHKRATDCAACARRTACDERAMLKALP